MHPRLTTLTFRSLLWSVVAVAAAAAAGGPSPAAHDHALAQSGGGENRDHHHYFGTRSDYPDELMRWRRLSLQDENGFVAPDGLILGKAHVDEMRRLQAARRAAAGAMTDVAGISNGAWTWIGPGNIGGRVRAIAVHPTSALTIFAGSVGGGIWKTTDGGSTWAVVDDFMANLAVSCIVFRPGTPTTMYAGTGEGFYNFDGIQGAGIFTSTDGGATWAQLTSTANSNFFYVDRLAMSSDGSILLAATQTGLYRSTDQGASFTPVLAGSPYGSDITDVQFIPGSSTSAVASGYSANAYYTTDGGATWTAATGPTSAYFTRVEIGVSVSSPTTVYLSIDHNSGEIWKSTNSGVSYTKVSTPGYLGGQGWYDNTIWVAPNDVSRLVAGGQYLATSTDGGATWTQLNYGQYIHPDHHAIVSSSGYDGVSNKTVYFGNDGGIYKAADVTTAFSNGGFTSLNNNLGVTQFYGIGGNTTSGKIIGGTQDNGTLLYTPAGGAEGWTSEFGGDGGFAAADPNDVNYLYGEYVYLQIHRSASGGPDANYIYGTGCGSGTLGDACAIPAQANFIAPFILDPNNTSRLLGGGWSLWQSNNVKATTPTWAAIKSPTTGSFPNSPISAIAVAPGNSDIVWIGHNSGEVYVTTNGTATTPTWTKVSGSTIPSRMVTRLTIDPTNVNVVYVTLGGFQSQAYTTANVWKTPDGGSTWTNIAGSGGTALPAIPVHSLAIHPNNSSWLYVGTELGVFASVDGGATWSLPQDGPANVAVDDLFWMGTTLVAGSHGRGLFTAAIPSAASTDLSVTNTAPATVAAGANLTYTITVTNNGPSDAATVSLSDAVPTNTTFVSFTAPGGWTVTTPSVGGTGTITATLPTLTNGAAPVFTLVVAVNGGVANGTVISDTAAISSATTDPTPGNNSATATTTASTPVAPLITSQPSNAATASGSNASFTVAASGNPTPTYQWQVSTDAGATWTNLANVAPYSNVATATLTIAASALVNGAQYRAVASNSVSPAATSNPATLTVTPSPSFSQQGSKLVGTGAAGSAGQGAVAISADGNTAIVGGPLDNNDVGAAWVWTRSAGVWTQQGSKLVGSGSVGIAYQGGSVSLSADGNTAIVGGNGDNGGVGAGWVWTRSGGVWTQQGAKLVGSGAVGMAAQGQSVSLSGDGNTAMVGAFDDNNQVGAAWVWTRSGGVWTQQGGKLVGSGAAGKAAQGFSASLSADGNTAIVGGQQDNTLVGAAWVWTRSGGVWTQQGSKLVGSGFVRSGNLGSTQGSAVSLSADGNTAIVGGAGDNNQVGAAWVWTRSGGVWTQQGSKLVGSDSAGSDAQLGSSVSLSADGNTAILGGPGDNVSVGATWVWTRSGGVWTQLESKLVGSGASGSPSQGASASLSADGNTIMAGGSGDNNNTGAAWVFATSAPAVPLFTTQPQNQAVTAGASPAFSVYATGTPVPTYQWQVSTNAGATWTNLTNTSPYSGVTGTSLVVSNAPVGLNNARYRVVATDGVGPANSNGATLTVYGAPSATPAGLKFGASKAGSGGALTAVTPTQSVTVSFAGASSAWATSVDQSWVQVTGGSGSGNGTFTVSIVNPSNVIGGSTSLQSVITLTAPNATVFPLLILVTLTVDQTGNSTQPAFGQVDTPAQNTTGIQGALAVTGWAVDDIGVASVKIYRTCFNFDIQANCVNVNGDVVVYVGDASIIAGARPDVEAAYPSYPASNTAGWGFLILTNLLPDVPNQTSGGGQGTFTLYVYATDIEGHITRLGRSVNDTTPTTVTMANDSIAKPFGAIDTPTQGGTASGASFANFGWVLTPDPGSGVLMPVDGSTIIVYVDGAPIGSVSYNNCRGTVGNPVPGGTYCNDDIASIFGNATPQATFTPRTSNPSHFRNLDAARGAIGANVFDTTAMTNGVHTIAWGVTDSASRAEGIGSRYFTVLNAGGGTVLDRAVLEAAPAQSRGPASALADVAPAAARVVGRTGFDPATPFDVITPTADGHFTAQLPELGRIELWLGSSPRSSPGSSIDAAYHVANADLRDLPPGSHLDPATGQFTWAPGPGYLGTYHFAFLHDGQQIPVDITIRPMTSAAAGTSQIRMNVDLPIDGATIHGPVTIAGWALDPQAWTGSGIGAVHVWAFRVDAPSAGPQFLGTATLGLARPDVANVFGAQFGQAGFSLTTTALTPGEYDVVSYAWCERTGRFEDARTVRVMVRESAR